MQSFANSSDNEDYQTPVKTKVPIRRYENCEWNISQIAQSGQKIQRNIQEAREILQRVKQLKEQCKRRPEFSNFDFQQKVTQGLVNNFRNELNEVSDSMIDAGQSAIENSQTIKASVKKMTDSPYYIRHAYPHPWRLS